MPAASRKHCPYCPLSAVCLARNWEPSWTILEHSRVTCAPVFYTLSGVRVTANRITFEVPDEKQTL